MQIQVFNTFDDLRYLQVVNGSERVPIQTKKEFECVFFNHAYRAQIGIPKWAKNFEFADVAFFYQVLPPHISFDRKNLPLFVRVDELPSDTSRMFFAFYFSSSRQVLLVGGIHVCFLTDNMIETKTLLSLATPEIWFRKRDEFSRFYPIYHQVFDQVFPRHQIFDIVKWRINLLVTGSESLSVALAFERSEIQKFQTAISWHNQVFEDYSENMRMMDIASFWSTLAASESFPPNLFKSYLQAEKWLIRIRASFLCKSEKEFEALIQNELGEPLNLSKLGFRRYGPQRKNGASSSDPWFSLPRRCPKPQFQVAYEQAVKKSGRLCVRKSLLKALSRPSPLFKSYQDPSSNFFTHQVYAVAKLVEPTVGQTSQADLGDLAVRRASCRMVYETAFENAFEALSLRRGVLSQGQIVVPWYYAYEILQSRFERRVAKAMQNGLLVKVFEDDVHFLKASSFYVDRLLVDQRRERILASKPDYLPQIDQVEPFLPPCMAMFVKTIKRQGKIYNIERFAFIPFLLKVGYSYESIRMYLESIWNREDWLTGDVQKELPSLVKRFDNYENSPPSTRRGFGMGCKGLASMGACPVVANNSRKLIGKIYDSPVVDIEDCVPGDAGAACANVLRWRGGRTKYPISSPQNFLKQILK